MVSRRQMSIALFAAAAATCLPARAHDAHAGPDAQQIIHVMKRQFDRPDAPLSVMPVVVVGDAAVTGWSQQGKGGRALLRKEKAGWAIHVCAGKGLTQAGVLEMSGLPKAQAAEMTRAVAQAEARLTAAQRALFDSFEGVLKVGGEGAAAHGHHGASAHAAPAHGAPAPTAPHKH